MSLLAFALAALGAAAAPPARAQEPAAADSAAPRPETLGAPPDTLGAPPDTLAPRAPDTLAPPPPDTLARPAQRAAPPADTTARTARDTLRAGGVALPDTLTPARADSLAAAQAADSLARVRRDIEQARERLGEVSETLKTFPQEDRLRRSPRGAVLRAFAVPGWGQFYTGHTFRGFMYAGAEVGFATLGFLKQQDVNDFKNEISRARLDFVAQEQVAHPDSAFSSADTLALFDRFDRTPQGAQLQATLEAKQKRREDYFTYAIFSMLFAAIDAFVSAHLEPYETPHVDVYRTPERWELDLRLPLGRGAPEGESPPGRSP